MSGSKEYSAGGAAALAAEPGVDRAGGVGLHARRRQPRAGDVLRDGVDVEEQRVGDAAVTVRGAIVELEAAVEHVLRPAPQRAVGSSDSADAMPISACCVSPSFLAWCQRLKPRPESQFM